MITVKNFEQNLITSKTFLYIDLGECIFLSVEFGVNLVVLFFRQT